MFSLSRQWVSILAATANCSALPLPALAGPTPDYGHDFVTIGDPGNRPVNKTEAPGFDIGRVDYRYRMNRTEITVGQWLGFVNSYAPYYEGPTNWSEFTSDWIVYDNSQGQYRAIAGSENYAANMGWRYAARYSNWLHNDKGLDQAAFENGAYDTSTFGRDDDGNFTDQREHNADAKFWIPTLDEWTKAMHWDPAMNDGEGGYWRYPHSSNVEPIVGPPGVGETNAAMNAFFDVGAYADVMSPWGLFDGSGGRSEWLEDGEITRRYLRGSSWALSTNADEIDYLDIAAPFFSIGGLRLVSVVPSPMTPVLFLAMASFLHRRR